ncbi:hypothetical protein PIB30_057853 [Stylosanthes scabra]|uniref:Uncharacterized protein n=1 Tax=Stylosanthes scabra TaxID=79078 RepID=A0ABU6XLC2_9FABA|nr:hypothetical protein [Stylosanthes scabra]
MGARPYSVAKERSCCPPFLQNTSGRIWTSITPYCWPNIILVGHVGDFSATDRSYLTSPHKSGALAACGPNGPKVGLFFGLRSRVRTLPLRGVVAVNGRTPRNRVPSKRA